MQGPTDERTELIAHSLQYIEKNKPKMVISENVPTMATCFKEIENVIVAHLQRQGYVVSCRIINTSEHGVPQTRKRWYLVGIREDCLRRRPDQSIGWFPDPTPLTTSLSDLVTPLPPSTWKHLPPKSSPLARGNAEKAFAKVILCIRHHIFAHIHIQHIYIYVHIEIE